MNETTSITLRAYGSLRDLLPSSASGSDFLNHSFSRKASIKDVIESLGIPHTEIADLIVNGGSQTFDYIVKDSDRIEIQPFTPPVDVRQATFLRPQPLVFIRFIVDVNVGKLASLLRLAGFDTSYQNHWRDEELARVAAQERRILLTRDRALLKRKSIIFGHLVREIEPHAQLAEIIAYYGLANEALPFSRCLRCNTTLIPVDKNAILHRLKPLTRKYYNVFHRCPDCGKIYWLGSHRDNMETYLRIINGTAQPNP